MKTYDQAFAEAVEKGACGFSLYQYYSENKVKEDYFLHFEPDFDIQGETYILNLNENGKPHTKQL